MKKVTGIHSKKEETIQHTLAVLTDMQARVSAGEISKILLIEEGKDGKITCELAGCKIATTTDVIGILEIVKASLIEGFFHG